MHKFPIPCTREKILTYHENLILNLKLITCGVRSSYIYALMSCRHFVPSQIRDKITTNNSFKGNDENIPLEILSLYGITGASNKIIQSTVQNS